MTQRQCCVCSSLCSAAASHPADVSARPTPDCAQTVARQANGAQLFKHTVDGMERRTGPLEKAAGEIGPGSRGPASVRRLSAVCPAWVSTISARNKTHREKNKFSPKKEGKKERREMCWRLQRCIVRTDVSRRCLAGNGLMS